MSVYLTRGSWVLYGITPHLGWGASAGGNVGGLAGGAGYKLTTCSQKHLMLCRTSRRRWRGELTKVQKMCCCTGDR